MLSASQHPLGVGSLKHSIFGFQSLQAGEPRGCVPASLASSSAPAALRTPDYLTSSQTPFPCSTCQRPEFCSCRGQTWPFLPASLHLLPRDFKKAKFGQEAGHCRATSVLGRDRSGSRGTDVPARSSSVSRNSPPTNHMSTETPVSSHQINISAYLWRNKKGCVVVFFFFFFLLSFPFSPH